MVAWLRAGIAFLKDDEGPTAVEYAIMMALVIAVCFVAMSVLGTNANQTFKKTATSIQAGS